MYLIMCSHASKQAFRQLLFETNYRDTVSDPLLRGHDQILMLFNPFKHRQSVAPNRLFQGEPWPLPHMELLLFLEAHQCMAWVSRFH